MKKILDDYFKESMPKGKLHFRKEDVDTMLRINEKMARIRREARSRFALSARKARKLILDSRVKN